MIVNRSQRKRRTSESRGYRCRPQSVCLPSCRHNMLNSEVLVERAWIANSVLSLAHLFHTWLAQENPHRSSLLTTNGVEGNMPRPLRDVVSFVPRRVGLGTSEKIDCCAAVQPSPIQKRRPPSNVEIPFDSCSASIIRLHKRCFGSAVL